MRVLNLKSFTQVSLSKEDETLQLYHERFAHQNKRYVKQILQRMNMNFIDSTDFCDGCALGEMHKLSFKDRSSQSEEVGDLIHSDVNGPMRTKFLGGSRYYVCFKDDYS